jgi:hypothetical protein
MSRDQIEERQGLGNSPHAFFLAQENVQLVQEVLGQMFFGEQATQHDRQRGGNVSQRLEVIFFL